MADLQTQLQAAVGPAYNIERELGGGGMSRVFVAEELELGRRVVIKVLPPAMAADVNVERFRREIQLAARLQHPHIVSVLTTGSHGDLLYYTMPFIEGESLRARLRRNGQFPIDEAVRLLREVADALAYAHRHEVIHRDIKPDNVLLSEGHAVVTDFGVAKAVSASAEQSFVTSVGMALGTPAYMAPEQAAADPNVDHRADIYALGAMGYEMLTGQPPFTGPNAQAVLAAHVQKTPEATTSLRETVPSHLDQLVMRCLQKKAADRWQSAAEMLPALDGILTPRTGVTPLATATVQSGGATGRASHAHPIRLAGLFALASVGALAIVRVLMDLIGLPQWVFASAIALLAIGLPIVLLTGHRQRKRALASMTGAHVATPTGLERHLTLGKAAVGGGLAFAGLGVFTAGYMTMRALGIGPVGTLIASGVLDEQDHVIVADFLNRTSDSTLGLSLTEALRVGLTESRVIRVADAAMIDGALRRMRRDTESGVDAVLAREIAEREGIQAVVAPEIGPIGQGYVLSARLLDGDGNELLAVAETAGTIDDVIEALGKLSTKLRERMGESLRTLARSEPLDQVTTASLDALRQYSIGIRAFNAGNYASAITALERAVTVDTAFAMAYRKLAQANVQAGLSTTAAFNAITRAYELRDRLGTQERYVTEGTYWEYMGDLDRAEATYRAVLEEFPLTEVALFNLGNIPRARKEWSAAEEQYRQFANAFPDIILSYRGPLRLQINQGKFDAGRETIDSMAAHFPDNPVVAYDRFKLAAAQEQYQKAVSAIQAEDVQRFSLTAQWGMSRGLAQVAAAQGRLAEARVHRRDEMRTAEQRGDEGGYLEAAIGLAWLDVGNGDATDEGWNVIESALERYPLDSIGAFDRPYEELVVMATAAGRLDAARGWLDEYTAVWDSVKSRFEGFRRDVSPRALGAVALAEDRVAEAIEQFRAYENRPCWFCSHVADLAVAYDRAGQPDSAIAALERFVETPNYERISEDAVVLPGVYRRLGEIYESRGDREHAIEYYNRFIELWQDADDELQPQVRDVRARIARLVGER